MKPNHAPLKRLALACRLVHHSRMCILGILSGMPLLVNLFSLTTSVEIGSKPALKQLWRVKGWKGGRVQWGKVCRPVWRFELQTGVRWAPAGLTKPSGGLLGKIHIQPLTQAYQIFPGVPVVYQLFRYGLVVDCVLEFGLIRSFDVTRVHHFGCQ